MARPCKICKLEKSHPEAFKSLTKQIQKDERGTMNKFLEKFNQEYGLNIIPMNVSRHKTHMEGNVHELKSKDRKQPQKNKEPDGEMEVYSPEGELLYTNIKEIIKSLNKRQREFCELFVNTYNHNATASYQEAFDCENYGSAASMASGLLKNLNVILYINYLVEERSKRLKISSSFVLTGLMENYARAMQAEPVLDREGNPTGVYTYNPNAANKALELIGKHLLMWDNKGLSDNSQMYKDLADKIIENKISPVMALVEMAKDKLPAQDLLKTLLNKADLSQLTAGPEREGDDLKKATTDELTQRLQLIESKKQKLLC
jgi:phage terminase small subunit